MYSFLSFVLNKLETYLFIFAKTWTHFVSRLSDFVRLFGLEWLVFISTSFKITWKFYAVLSDLGIQAVWLFNGYDTKESRMADINSNILQSMSR